MKRTRVLAYFFNLWSMSAVAGYECHLKLAHNDDLYKTVAEKTVSIEQGQMRSGNMGTLLVESQKGNRIVSLEINSVMSGWKGDEDAAFVILRKSQKKHSSKTSTVSEVMNIKGNDSITSWFDDYMLDIKCEVNNDEKKGDL